MEIRKKINITLKDYFFFNIGLIKKTLINYLIVLVAIAVIMNGETSKSRFLDATTLLNYGYANYQIYLDTDAQRESLNAMTVKSGVETEVPLKYEKDFANLTLFFENNDREFEAKITLLPDDRRKMELNGSKITKNSELMGLFNAVMFSPEDFLIIKEGPSERRRYIDIAISQVKPNYFNTLVEYNKVLKMKNKILKEEKNYSDLIDVYNEKLAKLGGDIIFYRNKYIEFIKTLTDKLHREITLSLDKFEIKYESCINPDERTVMHKEYLKKLNKFKSKEIFERTSLFGIHREDIGFFINGNRVREFASQGQQRTVILILRLCQAEYIKEIKGEYPVLLLDDILSELDSERRKYLLNEIRNKQVIITSTDKGSFARRKNTKLIHIDNAKIVD